MGHTSREAPRRPLDFYILYIAPAPNQIQLEFSELLLTVLVQLLISMIQKCSPPNIGVRVMVQKCWELLDSNSKMVFTHSPITKGRYRAAKNLVMITMVQLFSPCPPWIYFPFKCKIEAADGLAFPRLIRDAILHTTYSWSPNSTAFVFLIFICWVGGGDKYLLYDIFVNRQIQKT